MTLHNIKTLFEFALGETIVLAYYDVLGKRSKD